MTRIDQEYALVHEAENRIIAEMARDVLQKAGIPSLLHGPDFDVAELGSAVHGAVRGVGVYVPRNAETEARALLEHAFSGEVRAEGEPQARGPEARDTPG